MTMVDELRSLLARATPGKWAVHPQFAYIVPAAHVGRPIGGAEDDGYDLAHYAQEICALHMPDRHRSESETVANAALIVALRNNAEALLDALTAQDARVKELEALIRECRLADAHAARTGDEGRFDRAFDALCRSKRRASSARAALDGIKLEEAK